MGLGLTYLAVVCGVNLEFLGMSKSQFGHVVITNVGSLGYNAAFAPLCPAIHHMAILSCGKIERRAIVDENDEVKVASMMTMVGTGDHRYGDAAIFLPFFHAVMGYTKDPANFDEKKIKANVHYKEVKAQ